MLPARTLLRVNQPESGMTLRDDRNPTVRFHSCTYVRLANFRDEALTIPMATVLGIVEGISECLVEVQTHSDRH